MDVYDSSRREWRTCSGVCGERDDHRGPTSSSVEEYMLFARSTESIHILLRLFRSISPAPRSNQICSAVSSGISRN